MSEMTGYSSGLRPTGGMRASPAPANLADVLDRVLDKGLVIAGDISISLVDVELLTIKVRLLIASADKAAEMGIDWWRHDPALSSKAGEVEKENESLRRRLAELEARMEQLAPAPSTNGSAATGPPDGGEHP
jgi:hypothetical protein